MKLLYWGTVRPEAASDIAALRFTTPLHITLIRVFASEAQPFANCPEIVACVPAVYNVLVNPV